MDEKDVERIIVEDKRRKEEARLKKEKEENPVEPVDKINRHAGINLKEEAEENPVETGEQIIDDLVQDEIDKQEQEKLYELYEKCPEVIINFAASNPDFYHWDTLYHEYIVETPPGTDAMDFIAEKEKELEQLKLDREKSDAATLELIKKNEGIEDQHDTNPIYPPGVIERTTVLDAFIRNISPKKGWNNRIHKIFHDRLNEEIKNNPGYDQMEKKDHYYLIGLIVYIDYLVANKEFSHAFKEYPLMVYNLDKGRLEIYLEFTELGIKG